MHNNTMMKEFFCKEETLFKELQLSILWSNSPKIVIEKLTEGQRYA